MSTRRYQSRPFLVVVMDTSHYDPHVWSGKASLSWHTLYFKVVWLWLNITLYNVQESCAVELSLRNN